MKIDFCMMSLKSDVTFFFSLSQEKLDTNVGLISPLTHRQAISADMISVNLKLSVKVMSGTLDKAKLSGIGSLNPMGNHTYFQLSFRQYYSDYS